jgi:hypothetical protein
MLERASIAVVALIAAAIAHPLCNLFFHCGCAWNGPAHCNIHNASPPHCPWCTASWHFALAGAAWMLGAWAGIALARRRFGRHAVTSIALGVAGMLAGAVVSAVATKLLTAG